MIKAYGGNIVVVGDGYKDNEVAVIEREKTAKRMADGMENAFFQIKLIILIIDLLILIHWHVN